MRILIGLAFVFLGITGEAVLRGTTQSWPLILIGLFLIISGIGSISDRVNGR